MTAPIITPGKTFVFQVGAGYTAITDQTSDVSLNRTKTLLEAVTGGGRSFAVGFENSTVDISGPWEPTIDGVLNTIFASDTGQNWRFYPAGTAGGSPYYYGTALFTDYALTTTADGQVEWSGKMTVLTISRATV